MASVRFLTLTLLVWTALLFVAACGNDSNLTDGDTPDGDLIVDGDDDGELADGDADETVDPICTPGQWLCYDDSARWMCNQDGSDFTDLQACDSDRICVSGRCIALVCNPGQWSCFDDSSRQQCNDEGSEFINLQRCDAGEVCSFGECGVVQSCQPGQWACQDTQTRWQCLPDGSGYAAPEACHDGETCYEGLCSGRQVCEPGQWSCKDALTRWRCDAYGLEWLDAEGCGESAHCENGQCYADPSDGDIDGDSGDGDVDGDAADGDLIDGDDSDGDVIDGDETDGDIDGDVDADEELDGDEIDGDVELPPWPFTQCAGMTNGTLIACLHDAIDNHTSLGYDDAKDTMWADVDNHNGYVTCVYTGRTEYTSTPDNHDLNCEHTWPQSLGAGSEPMRSDMHHLFITDSGVNSRRSNYPFGYVVYPDWEGYGCAVGDNASYETVFEPRDVQKGDTARAIFYFAVRYGYSIAYNQEEDLRDWHWLDPPDAAERARDQRIYSYQHNYNPFVEYPAFLDAIDDF